MVVAPMTAPVVRFSLISPVIIVIIITNDVSETDMLMPSRMPIIIFCLWLSFYISLVLCWNGDGLCFVCFGDLFFDKGGGLDC